MIFWTRACPILFLISVISDEDVTVIVSEKIPSEKSGAGEAEVMKN